MFDRVLTVPAAQSLARRLEAGGALSFSGIAPAAQAFFAVWLQRLAPHRPLVVVAENLKAQESFQQDLETWLNESRTAAGAAADGGTQRNVVAPSSILHPSSSSLFYSAWETFPHEGKLPHADVISDRLQTLV
ncbi:MAG TPA: transcription-repair coupling factor, partial [Candidatus Binatia bacterium]|nr:transcription-repair coupling factor [Candidatus Binatia bacterium]